MKRIDDTAGIYAAINRGIAVPPETTRTLGEARAALDVGALAIERVKP